MSPVGRARRRVLSRTTPAVLVTGVDEVAMEAVTVGLQFDLPSAVVVRHVLDVESQRLVRVVSDCTGVLERHVHELEHACVACALREDVVPTMERLAASGRWGAVVAHLPVAAEALQACRVIETYVQAAPHVHVAAVVAALDGQTVLTDLLGDDLLHERDLHTSEDDSRGVAETAAAIVEYADAVALTGPCDPAGLDLLHALVRPGVTVVDDPSALDATPLVAGAHRHDVTEAWVDVVRRDELPLHGSPHVWTLDLRSDRPFHPGRLLESIERIGGGPRRSRGSFWLPSRPSDVCVWDGAGGQLSVGTASPWGTDTPLTRIVVHGLASGPLASSPDDVQEAFEHCLLSDAELADRGPYWEVTSDGLEPWLGDVRRAA
ncbi:GTP-binding protein [Aeromicrobium sp. 50.2.37]|uniref:GTP-binding protein n=1 Tax=Aeromicrobium sp. 50.2.37 TaxID=2969305 RepID=UPI0021502C51|nr:GTP-binding protein [Aeromicrobium sp. 50.2.37]MCR4513812.1 GTP-binding protein [Aeromicrobium sp. 50.2.37]